MALSLKCLPCKQQDLSLSPRIKLTKATGIMLLTHNPSAVKAETGISVRLTGRPTWPTYQTPGQ